jgi:hypothetical protein
MTAEPNSFFYVEQSDGTYIPEDDNDVCDIIARFQNSSITSDEVRFRADKVFVGGNVVPIFGYDDRDSNGKYDISGFTYDPSKDFTDGFVKQARGEFSVAGFDHIINSTLPNTCNTILISASGEKTSTERSIPINFIADGAASIYVELDVAQQVYKYNYDREFADTNKTLSLKAIPYNTYGSLHYIFSTGKDLDNLVEIANQQDNTTHIISNLDQKFDDYDDTPFLAHVEISGIYNTNVIASDFVTIYGALPGKDSYTVFLDNENVSFPSDENNRVHGTDYQGFSTNAVFMKGNETYTYDAGANPDTGTYSFKSIEKSDSNIQYSDTKKSDQLNIEITSLPDYLTTGSLKITLQDNHYKAGSTRADLGPIEFERLYTFSKIKEGSAGRTVDLSANPQAVQYNSIGGNPHVNGVTVTADAGGFYYTPQFVFRRDGVQQGSMTATNTFNFPTPSSYTSSGLPTVIEVDAYDSFNQGASYVKKSTDKITISKLKEGSNGITVLQSQEFVTITVGTDANGQKGGLNQINTVANLNTTINLLTVFEGTDSLEYGGTSGNQAGKYYATASTDNCTISSSTVSGRLQTKLTGWTSASNSKAKVTYSIKTVDHDGGERNFTVEQNLSLSFDGQKGNKGAGIVFRGEFDSSKTYQGATEESLRGDVVFYGGKYWMALAETTSSTPSSSNNDWEDFTAQFDMVATDILLAQDATITHTLTMGEGDVNSNNQYIGNGGIIKTAGKEYGNGVTGFFIGNEKDNGAPNPKFDIGGTDSYIRFNGLENRIELKGSLILNGLDASAGSSSIGFNSLDGTNATFIGGGYDNSITGYGGYHGLASAIIGGAYNDITGRFSTIAGGFDNNVGDNFSFIGGGFNNEMPESTSGNAGANIIGAGSENKIYAGSHQGIFGGKSNIINYTPPANSSITPNGISENIVLNPDTSILSPRVLGNGSQYAKIFQFDPGMEYIENSWLSVIVGINKISLANESEVAAYHGSIFINSTWIVIIDFLGLNGASAIFAYYSPIMSVRSTSPVPAWIYFNPGPYVNSDFANWNYIDPSVWKDNDYAYIYNNSNSAWIAIGINSNASNFKKYALGFLPTSTSPTVPWG